MAHPSLPPVVSPLQLAAAREQRPDIRLLDVRTPGEFAGAHLDGAHNVPLDRLEEHAPVLRAVTSPVVLICRAGARARSADVVLRRAGMGNLHVLDGGMLAWRRVGLPVLRAPVTPARMLRWGIAAAAVVAGMLLGQESPLLTAALFFVGLRVGIGRSLLPCAAGACAPRDDGTSAVVRAFVDGGAPHGAARRQPAASEAA